VLSWPERCTGFIGLSTRTNEPVKDPSVGNLSAPYASYLVRKMCRFKPEGKWIVQAMPPFDFAAAVDD